MIITIRKQATSEERAQLIELLCRISGSLHPMATTSVGKREVIALDGSSIDAQAQILLRQQPAVEDLLLIKTPYQLVSRAFQVEQSSITIGADHGCDVVTVGGTTASPVIMAGPCSVENREQILSTARAVKAAGAVALRGGAFKPRTSPYQFRGLGLEGLHMLAEAREETGLPIITEVMEPDMVEAIAEHADVLQIGTRNMQNYPLLLAAGRHSQKRPVLLKRGFAATLDEWLLAAEYIVAAGNPNVILCERGIRSHDPQTRNVLDLTCVPLLHNLTHLPIIVDPSHATGKSELVPIMSRASLAAGAEGLIIEVHEDPAHALSDGRQSITPTQLHGIVGEAEVLARMLSREASLVSVA
ncbi:3-deoxy-7-phosphoheptulonate synthase [Ktedonosporobacter rubrisoli]|uniref:3-deoxy-7-phosphoheptulonate synthase n=1 Tax=Ktedonosporobacter rubrisoli TaxID=2509675 RepID=A0A4P6JZ60_KTERU|nr:3-deoxy-7-phosphoheptulonate synthase [Ktedonosporobacter rubrisoli]QBD81067.1 3-deoxy-7-phosphoheptulonate synthase [Ktedonosporobacter rubrisoli]